MGIARFQASGKGRAVVERHRHSIFASDGLALRRRAENAIVLVRVASEPVIRLFVGNTDLDWFEFLSRQPALDEVNFWKPSGQQSFRAIQEGELFLFRLKTPINAVAGGGVFKQAVNLPVSLAWRTFGVKNGAGTEDSLRSAINRYRSPGKADGDPIIGCRILTQPFFLPERQWHNVPESWSPQIVPGKRYSTDDPEGRELWSWAFERLQALGFGQSAGFSESAQARFGEPTLIAPRLGQGAFRIAVIQAYGRSCAVTKTKTLPVLEAGHIQPYSEGGAHEVSNGLLLRSDLHTLFDHGYVTVTPQGRLEVSRRIKEEFDNGREYYALHGSPIRPPASPSLRPAPALLRWHNEHRYKG